MGIVLAVLSVLVSCTEDDEYTRGQWIRRSDFDGVARCGASSFTMDGKGYLCCGYRGSNRDLLKDCWAYDIENGKGYVTTGAIKDEPDYLADTWEYDPASDTWTQKDDFAGGMRCGAIGFAVGGYGYVGTGFDDNYLKDFYRFDPNAAAGSQWQIVNGFEGGKRVYGLAFVIDDVAYVGFGENNNTYVEDFYSFDGTTWTRLRDIADTNDDEDYDDDYAIARSSTVAFVIDGKGYVATGDRNGVTSDYWMYDPEQDLWYGDADDDYTPLTSVHYSTGGSSRSQAVGFSTGTRGFVLTGQSGNSYFDDVYELLPYELEDD